MSAAAALQSELESAPQGGPLERAYRLAVLVDNINRVISESGLVEPELFELAADLLELAAQVVEGAKSAASPEFRSRLVALDRRHAEILRRVVEVLKAEPSAERAEAMKALAEREAVVLEEVRQLAKLDVGVRVDPAVERRAN